MLKKYLHTSKKVLSISLIAATFTTLAGCGASKQDVGTGVGAVAGGLIGSRFGGGGGQIAATVVGAGAGAVIGNQVGKSMDQSDENAAQLQAIQDANPSGQGYYGNDADYSYPA
jgi:uncharacterized protein YcfJ